MSDKEKDTINASSSDQKTVAKSSGKGNIFKRIGRFFKEYRAELKKISWPTFPEVVKNTIITLAVVLMIGVVIWVFDFAVSWLRDLAIASETAVSASDVVASDTNVPTGSDVVGTVSDGSAVIDPSASDVQG